MNDSSIRTSLDAQSQKDKINNLSQYNNNKVINNNSSAFKIQMIDDDQDEYLTSSKYDKSPIQKTSNIKKNTLNAFTQTEKKYYIADENEKEEIKERIKPQTEDKYCQAVEENELQKLYDEWQITHDK